MAGLAHVHNGSTHRFFKYSYIHNCTSTYNEQPVNGHKMKKVFFNIQCYCQRIPWPFSSKYESDNVFDFKKIECAARKYR